MIKKYSQHLIGYGSFLFFLGLFSLSSERITINLIIPLSTIVVLTGTIGWVLKPKEKKKEVKYVSKVDQGFGYLWDNIIPKFWTGMILILMIIFNFHAIETYRDRRTWNSAKRLALEYEPLIESFGKDIHFGRVYERILHSDTVTTFKLNLRSSRQGNRKVSLCFSHGKKPLMLDFKIAEE